MAQSLEGEPQVADLGRGGTEQATCGAPCAGAPSITGKRRVLVVDDEESILSSLRRLFRREAYEVLCANCAEEALRVLEAEPAHVVISDYRMPGKTGIELLRTVQDRWPDTIRVVLSGYSEVNAIISAINDGAIYKFISKPWNDEELKLNVRRALDQYELAAENRRMAREIAQQNEKLLELNRTLDERASDASAGLIISQDLLEAIEAGMVIVDESGLIVSANRKAWEVLCPQSEGIIGMPACEVLPNGLFAAISAGPIESDDAAAGHLALEGRKLQWRARSLREEGKYGCQVVTLWEEVV